MTAAAPLTAGEAYKLFSPLEGAALLLAVSGGADSMALLHLVADWQRRTGAARSVSVATVDHQLRPASAGEASWVGEIATTLGLTHTVLAWEAEKPATGLQAAARAARYRLLMAHARTIPDGRLTIVTAHHLDDQAETFLMRLGRGSGLDGLSAIQPITHRDGVAIARPFLTIAKARLVATLSVAGHPWIEDPSNQLDQFERVRIRKALPTLDSLGISPSAIALSAQRLWRTRRAVEYAHESWFASAVELHPGLYAHCQIADLAAAPEEIAIRALAQLAELFGGQSPRPRLAELEALLPVLVQGDGTVKRTLGGAVFRVADGHLEVWREPGRSGLPSIPLSTGTASIWDRRFRIELTGSGQELQNLEIRALGPDGLRILKQVLGAEIPENIPTEACYALPAVWRGPDLCTVPYFKDRLAALYGQSETGHKPVLHFAPLPENAIKCETYRSA